MADEIIFIIYKVANVTKSESHLCAMIVMTRGRVIIAGSNIMKAGDPTARAPSASLPATPSPYNGHTLNLKERSFSRPVRSSLYYITIKALLYGEGHSFS